MQFNYSPIVLDSINPQNFPQVELYIKQEKNFALYKPQDTKLTTQNFERLQENGTEFVYINSANQDEVQTNLEKNLDNIISNESLPRFSKNLIFSHIIISCINDVFKNPNMAAAYHKCRTILKLISLEIEDRDELITLFSKLEQHYEKYLVTHTAQVTILSMFLYKRLFNADQKELVEIGVGAMLHDIGMLHIASNIVEKTDVLTESEYHRVKFHPRHGHDMLYQVGIKEQVPLDIALSHHEHFDGSGYPRGLSEYNIPRQAMVVSVCDIYCALTMNRPYRGASTPEEALRTLKIERKLFDPDIFDRFFGIMNSNIAPVIVTEEKIIPQKIDTTIIAMIQGLRRELRDSIEDRNKLLQLHSTVTDKINNSFGEEKGALVAFRNELKDVLNSQFAADRRN